MAVMSHQVGETLRRAREARGLTLAEAERQTKIRAVYLQALEDERADVLPSGPYAKGFLRAYARLLGLDAERLVDEFEQYAPAVPAAPLTKAPEPPIRPAVPRSRLRRLVGYALWTLAALGVFILYVGYLQVREFSQPVLQPAAPDASSTPAPGRPFDDANPPASVPIPTVQGPDLPPSDRVTLQIAATSTSWIRVTADGRRVFQGFLRAGESQRWDGEREIVIRIGNAGGLALMVNGRSLGVPGRRGQVVTRRFTVAGSP